MRLNSKFSLTTAAPIPGTHASIYESAQPQEMVDGENLGVGPGGFEDSGTPILGTIPAGTIVTYNDNGNVEKMSSPNLGSDFPKLPYVCMGDNDFDNAASGHMGICQGGVRFETEQYEVAAGPYLPGIPLIASALNPGKLTRKVLVGDGFQIVAYVGPKGEFDGVLDVTMPQGNQGG